MIHAPLFRQGIDTRARAAPFEFDHSQSRAAGALLGTVRGKTGRLWKRFGRAHLVSRKSHVGRLGNETNVEKIEMH